jgi:signal transduction histidine kinase
MHALQESASQAQRAGRVVRELLEFLHRRETSTEAIDLNAVVQEALSIVEASGFDGFRALVNLAPDLKPVRANRLQVEKVMVNLLRNSVEAMRGAGIAAQQITISVSTAADGEMALVTVRDTGPGMDEAVARRVFDPFFTTKPEGVGMGLAISRALVQANGGTLWFDASAGAGATFHFTLPFAR